MNSEDIEYYKQFMLSQPQTKLVSGGKMILTRCKECGDSIKNLNHAHMYISLPTETEPSLFYCHKCNTGGVMTTQTLLKWGIFDFKASNYLEELNKEVMKLGKNYKYKDRDVYTLYNNFVSQNRYSELKLNYINSRLGINLNYMDCLNRKIVLNINDLLSYNKIEEYTRHENIIKQFNDYFLGFISADNAFVNMRRLVDKGIVYEGIDERYQRYNIFGKYDNTEKFYLVPTSVDLTSTKRIKINISEGEFDILSVLYNLRKDENNCIYSSVGGSNYIGLINYFLRVLKLHYVEYHFYMDNDIHGDGGVIQMIKDYIEPFKIPMYVHRNIKDGEKDFGVSPDKINESILKINSF